MSHVETIKCPKCGSIEQATVEHTEPWWTFIHNCKCGYIIMESEWENADPTITDGYTTWSKRCLDCGELTMQVVRPGKVQCAKCG